MTYANKSVCNSNTTVIVTVVFKLDICKNMAGILRGVTNIYANLRLGMKGWHLLSEKIEYTTLFFYLQIL